MQIYIRMKDGDDDDFKYLLRRISFFFETLNIHFEKLHTQNLIKASTVEREKKHTNEWITAINVHVNGFFFFLYFCVFRWTIQF